MDSHIDEQCPVLYMLWVLAKLGAGSQSSLELCVQLVWGEVSSPMLSTWKQKQQVWVPKYFILVTAKYSWLS